MEDETFELTTNFCWVCFAGKMPASNILCNILWVQEDEIRARIVDPAEINYGCSAGIEPVTSR
jgi:hypothetical protein